MKLTAVESFILLYRGHGSTTKETAKRLGISPETVKTHLRSIKLKIEAQNLLNDSNKYLAEIQDLKNQIAILKGIK